MDKYGIFKKSFIGTTKNLFMNSNTPLFKNNSKTKILKPQTATHKRNKTVTFIKNSDPNSTNREIPKNKKTDTKIFESFIKTDKDKKEKYINYSNRKSKRERNQRFSMDVRENQMDLMENQNNELKVIFNSQSIINEDISQNETSKINLDENHNIIINEILSLLNTIFIIIKTSAENNEVSLKDILENSNDKNNWNKSEISKPLSLKEKAKILSDINKDSLERKKKYKQIFSTIDGLIEEISQVFLKASTEKDISIIKNNENKAVDISESNATIIDEILSNFSNATINNTNINISKIKKEEIENESKNILDDVDECTANTNESKNPIINRCPQMKIKKNNLNKLVSNSNVNTNLSTKDTLNEISRSKIQNQSNIKYTVKEYQTKESESNEEDEKKCTLF